MGAADDNAAGYVQEAWQTAYFVMAASMVVGLFTVLISKEPTPAELPPARNAKEWLQGALIDPFADFIKRYKWQAAFILSSIAVYRISDVVMGITANPFHADMRMHQGRGCDGDRTRRAPS
jgi:PAT family beta-lactamase induction signal transducer AmpG